MKLTNIMLNEKSQTKQIYIVCMLPFRQVLKQAQLIWDIKVRSGVTSGEDVEGSDEGHEGISGGAGNVLLLDLGGGHMSFSFWENSRSYTCMIYALFHTCVIVQQKAFLGGVGGSCTAMLAGSEFLNQGLCPDHGSENPET